MKFGSLWWQLWLILIDFEVVRMPPLIIIPTRNNLFYLAVPLVNNRVNLSVSQFNFVSFLINSPYIFPYLLEIGFLWIPLLRALIALRHINVLAGPLFVNKALSADSLDLILLEQLLNVYDLIDVLQHYFWQLVSVVQLLKFGADHLQVVVLLYSHSFVYLLEDPGERLARAANVLDEHVLFVFSIPIFNYQLRFV